VLRPVVPAHILVIGAQSELADRVHESLKAQRLRLSISSRDAAEVLAYDGADLVIGLALSHFSLLHLCQTLRADRRTRSISILALANEGYGQAQVLEAFQAGVDDCLVAPFALGEMLARVGSLLRRTAPADGSTKVLTFDDLELDRVDRRVKCGTKSVHLSPREFGILEALMEKPLQVRSRAQLQHAGWGRAAPENERNVDAVIGRINKALGSPQRAHRIRSVRGVGYMLGPPKA
jgi:two-component system phosphate regulon response regulator PhoB